MATGKTQEMGEWLSKPLLVLSPHLDDGVLSCGGLLAAHKNARVLTLYSGGPDGPRQPPWHKLALPKERQEEDRKALAHLGVEGEFLGLQEAIDRTNEEGSPLYPDFASVFGMLQLEDTQELPPLVESVRGHIDKLGAKSCRVVAPLGVGAHVDHQMCAHAARRLARSAEALDLWFYQDAPYCFPNYSDSIHAALGRLRAQIVANSEVPIDRLCKEEAIACYPSQVASLFGTMDDYVAAAEPYYQELGGSLEIYHRLRFR